MLGDIVTCFLVKALYKCRPFTVYTTTSPQPLDHHPYLSLMDICLEVMMSDRRSAESLGEISSPPKSWKGSRGRDWDLTSG
jgi:hypothetical protein